MDRTIGVSSMGSVGFLLYKVAFILTRHKLFQLEILYKQNLLIINHNWFLILSSSIHSSDRQSDNN